MGSFCSNCADVDQTPVFSNMDADTSTNSTNNKQGQKKKDKKTKIKTKTKSNIVKTGNGNKVKVKLKYMAVNDTDTDSDSNSNSAKEEHKDEGISYITQPKQIQTQKQTQPLLISEKHDIDIMSINISPITTPTKPLITVTGSDDNYTSDDISTIKYHRVKRNSNTTIQTNSTIQTIRTNPSVVYSSDTSNINSNPITSIQVTQHTKSSHSEYNISHKKPIYKYPVKSAGDEFNESESVTDSTNSDTDTDSTDITDVSDHDFGTKPHDMVFSHSVEMDNIFHIDTQSHSKQKTYDDISILIKNKNKHIKNEEIPSIFYQLSSLKQLNSNIDSINIILDDFLNDYNMYKSASKIPYKYVFSHNIISNLIDAWELGIKKVNSKLITYSIQSLCKFTDRDEFRTPFLAKHGIKLIEQTLKIPSFNKKQLFNHIPSVLKITRDICQLQVIDTMLWCKHKIHQEILTCMQRNYDEEKITKACRNTLISLLDASYEVGKEIINSSQIHNMIDSFLDTTKNEYISNVSTLNISQTSINTVPLFPPIKSNMVNNNSLQSMNMSISASPTPSGTPALVDLYGSSDKSLTNKPGHHKKKNLFELEEEKKKQQKNSSIAVKSNDNELLKRMSIITDGTEYSDYTSDNDDHYDVYSIQHDDDDYEFDDTLTDNDHDHHSDSVSDTDNAGSSPSGTPQPQPQNTLARLDNNTTSAASVGSRSTDLTLVSALSKRSVFSTDTVASDDTADTHIYYGNDDDNTSIISLKEFDKMVQQNNNNVMDQIEEEEQDFEDEEKSFLTSKSKNQQQITTSEPSLSHNKSRSATGTGSGNGNGNDNDIRIHSLNSLNNDNPSILIIELKSYQLLYINSLFLVIYKIITLKKRAAGSKGSMSIKSLDLDRVNSHSVRNQNQSFMELLKNKRKNASSNNMTGSTGARLSSNDRMYMSDTEFILKNSNNNNQNQPNDAAKIQKKQNKLLESFCSSLSFKNLFKLLKCYKLTKINDDNDDNDQKQQFNILDNDNIYEFNDNNDNSGDDNDDDDDDNIIEILSCKILHKIIDYSDIIIDKLLFNDTSAAELDLINILISLLFNHSSNTDLIIYVLDIFTKLTLNNEDTRELFLNPIHFDPFLRSLDKWWFKFINNSSSQLQSKQYNDNKMIEVTIGMLKFFNQLSSTNALDMVQNRINDRILIILDYYLNVSLREDINNADDIDVNGIDDNNLFVFNDTLHFECLSLSLECISSLSTDINMLLEFVCSRTCEKLSRICWSFRNNSSMIKKCCSVLSKLLKLEQSCLEIINQNVIEPLYNIIKYIFQKIFLNNRNQLVPIKLLVVADLFPNYNMNNNNKPTLHMYKNSNNLPSPRLSDNTGTASSNDIIFMTPINKSDQQLQKRVRFHGYHANSTSLSSIADALPGGSYHSRSLSINLSNNLGDIREILNVFINLLCIDDLCIKICHSDLILLLIEFISNKSLCIHDHMMISLLLSDFIQRLTANKIGAAILLKSSTYSITKYICYAIQNNISNRGVLLKYLRSLQNLKNINSELVKKQLHQSNQQSVEFLSNINLTQQYQAQQIINEIIHDTDDNDDNDDDYDDDYDDYDDDDNYDYYSDDDSNNDNDSNY